MWLVSPHSLSLTPRYLIVLMFRSLSCVPFSLPPLFTLSLPLPLFVSPPLSPSLGRPIGPGSVLRSVYESTGCSGQPLRHIVHVEHVIVRVTITHGHRGDLSIVLTSPSGTKSQLLANR